MRLEEGHGLNVAGASSRDCSFLNVVEVVLVSAIAMMRVEESE